MSSQPFHPITNVIAKLSIAIIILGLGLVSLMAWVFFQSPFMRGITMSTEQPVPYSHKVHVGQLGLDCRYCHTDVENSAFANVPSSDICMGCHSQVWAGNAVFEPVRASYEEDKPLAWNRVYDLPDYVYFNHSIHLNKGVGCETCHGRLDQMPLTRKESTLTMRWCLECHRNRAKYIRPRDQVFTIGWQAPDNIAEIQQLLVEEYHVDVEQFNITDCSICHR
ncbi:MAG: cytochrome c3 family protein [Chloroflexi bacterium]|nr:cytochrome c3 family protein [Chloroflexota bacterium]